jgi:outer membrane cobalamin receptor
MSRPSVIAALAFIITVAPLRALAQEALLDPIVVTGSFEPVVASDRPQRVVAVDYPVQTGAIIPGPAEALRMVPGVEVRSSGGTGAVSVSIRGAEFGQVLGLFRGVPVNSPLAGGLDFGALPVLPAETASVELLAGPASGVYGTDAIGGAVNVVPSPIDPDAGLVIGLTGGTLDSGSLSVLGSGGHGDLLWRAGGGFFTGHGDRDNSSASTGILVGETRFHLPCGRTLSLDLRHLNRTSDVPGPEAFPSANASQRDTKSWLTISIAPEGDGLQTLLMGRIEKMRYTDPDFATDSTHRFADLTGRALWNGAIGAARLTAGAEGTLTDASSTDSGDHAEENGALFLLASGRLGTPVLASGGLRCDFTDAGRSEISPSVGLVADLSGGLSGVFSFARAFRAPTLNERYWKGPGGEGNPGLSPETAVEASAGLRWKHSQATLAATAFRREVDDLIVWKDEDGDWTWTPVNVASARITGVETDAVWAPSENFSLRGGWSWLNPVDGATDEPIAGRPRHTVTAALAVTPTPATRGDLTARWSDHHRDADGTRRSFVVVGLSASRDLTILGAATRISLAVENLFERAYQEVPGYPMPGRRITLGMEVLL